MFTAAKIEPAKVAPTMAAAPEVGPVKVRGLDTRKFLMCSYYYSFSQVKKNIPENRDKKQTLCLFKLKHALVWARDLERCLSVVAHNDLDLVWTSQSMQLIKVDVEM